MVVLVRDLMPGQEIDQVLMVRTSDARRLVLGDRTGTLEAAPQDVAPDFGPAPAVTNR